MRRGAAAAVAWLALALPARARAACGEPGARPRLGLVLSGGGARGIAHVGVLKALEEQGVRPDCIAGTSMGALIGALYASGYSAARIEQIVRSVDWQRIYSGRAERELVPLARRMEEMRPLVRLGFGFWKLRLPRAAEPDYRLRRFLTALLTAPSVRARRDFDRLPIPFRAVAADLATGERVILSAGSLEGAVRASVSAPVTLEPVREGGRWLVDGGVVDNMPVGVARAMGADVVIAVDARSPPAQPGAESDVVQVAGVLADVLIRRRNEDFRTPADLVLSPGLAGITNTSYEEYERALAAGYTAARAQAAAIRGAAGAAAVAAAATDGSDGPPASPAPVAAQTVTDVRVEGLGAVHDTLVREAFAVRPGQAFDLQAALRGLDAVWATRLFRSAWLDTIPSAGGVDLVVHVHESEKRLLEVTAAFDETDKAEGIVRLRDVNLFGRGQTLELLARASDALSAVRIGFAADGVLGSPVGYFVQASLSEWRPRPFQDGEPLARAEFDRASLVGALQTHPSSAVLLRGGFERARVQGSRHDAAGIVSGTDQVATLGALAAFDTLDDRWDPTHGGLLSLQVDHSLRALGADERYWRAVGHARAAWTLGRAGTLQLDGFGFTSGGDIPRHEQVQFGGPVLAPGQARDALWGQHGGGAALSQRIQVVGALQLVLRAGLAGVWERRSDVSLSSAARGVAAGLRHDTPVGPVALEWGHAQGHSRVYVSIGYLGDQ
jgi:NTE family protein